MVELDVNDSVTETNNEIPSNFIYCDKSINEIIKLFSSAKISELTELFDSCSEDNEEEEVFFFYYYNKIIFC